MRESGVAWRQMSVCQTHASMGPAAPTPSMDSPVAADQVR